MVYVPAGDVQATVRIKGALVLMTIYFVLARDLGLLDPTGMTRSASV